MSHVALCLKARGERAEGSAGTQLCGDNEAGVGTDGQAGLEGVQWEVKQMQELFRLEVDERVSQG